ncbi:MAG: GGDEF domain-containing protein [Planctomycetota bacterium]|nr:GGDEF domain-containing protein [Planctomycetota bacterium]
MNEQLANKIRQCPSLPSLPAIALQVIELAQDVNVDIAEIARIISKDPALSSKILRTVNSSFYARSSISTISHALVILGLQSVKTLVLGFSLVTRLSKNRPKSFNHLSYWRRSTYAATAARILSGKLQLVQQEECFLAALLGDIGELVLDQVLPDQYGEVHESVSSHEQLAEAEQRVLGIIHADATQVLAELWKLPPILAVPMSNHHRPEDVSDPLLRRLTQVVRLAGRCADVFVDKDAAAAIASVRKMSLENHRITEADCDAMLDQIGTRTKEVASLFKVNISETTSYEAILKKANETLVELTLRTQHQAATLEQQNIQLKAAATTDALTGLANRAQFDQFLTEQFTVAAGNHQPLSMLLIDVDHFKRVNDCHGHPVGDQVLRAIGKVLKGAARAQDLAARYGGEEMSLIMPSTTRATAAAIAESIRRAIAAKPIPCQELVVPVTVSVGVASFEVGGPLREPAHLIKAADMAMYAAKGGGRNCVKVFSIKSAATQAMA